MEKLLYYIINSVLLLLIFIVLCFILIDIKRLIKMLRMKFNKDEGNNKPVKVDYNKYEDVIDYFKFKDDDEEKREEDFYLD